MREVLISIRPEWCELIVKGRKTVEVRKTKPKLGTPFKVYISSIQAEFNALMGVISSMPAEQAEKFKGAVKKLCGAIVSRCD